MSRPRPYDPSPVTRPFWEATAEGRFLFQRCGACGAAIFYPRPACNVCGGDDLRWEQASGDATVHTFSIARRPTHPKFTGDEPYVVAIVELAEGPHVTTNIVGCDPEDVRIGMAVRLTFEDVGPDGFALPLFEPA
ncbi:MAG: Zn-ribbon domain-containing OB-fold protein [Acidimicrobiia bacterium]